jgi:hypothetical protein
MGIFELRYPMLKCSTNQAITSTTKARSGSKKIICIPLPLNHCRNVPGRHFFSRQTLPKSAQICRQDYLTSSPNVFHAAKVLKKSYSAKSARAWRFNHCFPEN